MQRKKQIERELWLRGILTWKLRPEQRAIEKAYGKIRNKLFVGDCSRQLGKSYWAVVKSVETMLQKKNCRIRYATAFLTDLEQFIEPAFSHVLADAPKCLGIRYLAHKKTYICEATGSKIVLVGLDRKPNGLRGNKLQLVVLDEAGFMSRLKYIYNSVIIPAMTHTVDGRVIMISTQPESPDHDFVHFCDKAAHPDENGYAKFNIYQSSVLSKEKIEEIAKEVGGVKSTAFRREYLCERIVEESRALVPEFDELRHVVATPYSEFHKFYLKLESLDSGVTHKTAFHIGYYDFLRAKLVIEDEFTLWKKEVTTRAIAEHTRAKERSLGYDNIYRRISDNNNLILLQDLGVEYGLNFAPTDKDELPAMVNKMRLWFQLGRIEIHPRCVQTIACFKAAIWTEKRDKFAESDVHGHYDLVASLMYMVRNVPESINPIPETYQVDFSNQIFISKRKSVSDNASNFSRALNG